MYPFLFGAEFLDMFIIMISLGVLLALVLFIFLLKKRGVNRKVISFYYTAAAISIAVGFVSAFLVQALYNYIDHVKTGAKFTWQGMTFFGGLIGGAAAFVGVTFLLGKKEDKAAFPAIANCAAPAIVIAHAFGRLGCFCAGCCYGIESEHFGVRFPYPRYKVIPTNLYESLFLFVLLGVLMLLFFRFKKRDILLIIYAYAYGVFRFLIEFLRGDNRGEFLPFLSPSQWQAIFLLIAAAILTVVYIKKMKKAKLSKK